jgi:tetratricopeptide (TPR) repeat protein
MLLLSTVVVVSVEVVVMRCTFWLLSSILLLASPVWAQTSSNVEEVAKRYYQLGAMLYARSDYEGAMRSFKEAYRLTPRAALLYDVARCQESLGRHRAAIVSYSDVLRIAAPAETAPGTPLDGDQIRQRVTNLRELVRKQDEERIAAERAREEAERAAHAHPPKRLALAGWITTGMGAATLVTGAILAGLAHARQSQVGQAGHDGQDWSQAASLDSQGRAFRTSSIALFAVGGVAAATGVTLLILDARRPRAERRVWFTPTVGPQQAGFVAGGRF